MPPLSEADLYAPFRPRRGRAVAYVLAVALVVLLAAIALSLPGEGPSAWQWYDRLLLVALGLASAAVLHRLGSVRAVPTPETLTVRNVLFRRRLEWAQVVAVRFGGGGPWVTLDLDDGDTLAVMGVQRADGEYAEGEARRLATLVQLHSGTSRDD